MSVRAISAEQAWQETDTSGRPILDLRTRVERQKFGRPPGSVTTGRTTVRPWVITETKGAVG